MESILLFAALFSAILMVIGLIKPTEVFLASKAPTRIKVVALYGSAAIVLTLAFIEVTRGTNYWAKIFPDDSVAATTPMQEHEYPQHIKERLESKWFGFRDVTVVGDTNSGYEVSFTYAPTYEQVKNGTFFPRASIATYMNEAGNALSDQSFKISSLVMRVHYPYIDKYGHISAQEALVLTLNGEEFVKVNWKNIGTKVLDLTKVRFAPQGLALFHSECSENFLFKPEGEFCSQQRSASGR